MMTEQGALALATTLREVKLFSHEYDAIRHELSKAKVFKCDCCGQMVAYTDLEAWACDFDEVHRTLICSSCYEDEMGEDL